MLLENEIAKAVFDTGLKVHKTLGPGLLESVYQHCLAFDLQQLGFRVREQAPLPIVYNGVKLQAGYRVDILIEETFIVEIKAVDALNDLHLAQTLTYLRLFDKRLALLINFNTVLFKNGVRRVVNGL